MLKVIGYMQFPLCILTATVLLLLREEKKRKI